MKFFAILACACALLLTATPTRAQAPADLSGRLDLYVRSFADLGLFSGVVLVRKDGRTVYHRAYGVAERGFGTPLAPDTRFQIASLSKPITAAAVARLVDQGKLSFDAPVSTWLDGIPNGDKITIDQLLTHHSGLDSPDRKSGSESWMRLPNTTAQLVDRVRALPPAAAPGEKYFYSNGNYWILAHLIEKLSGLSYGEFLRREIFEPLGMKDSGHRGDLLLIVPRLAGGYAPEGVSAYRQADLVDWTSKTGNGSLYSTASDLALFYEALQSGRLLRPETTRRVFGVGKSIGYGWFNHLKPVAGHRTIFFNGRSPGFTAHLQAFPDDNVSFVILSNLYVYSPTIMAEGVSRILWDQPVEPQRPIRVAKVRPADLEALAGTFQFGPTFFVKDGFAELIARGDHMLMRWPSGGLVTTLLPMEDGSFFDPTFWATIRFETGPEGRLIKYNTHGYAETWVARRRDPPPP